MQSSVTIRAEHSTDVAEIAEVTREALRSHPHGSGMEHLIIDALRISGALTISLVAEANGQVVGHIAFSPVTVTDGSPGWYGLGPIAVRPSLQRRGIGRSLVRSGLVELRDLGARGCVVVGEPEYYERFGFRANKELLFCGVPEQYFLCMRFTEESVRGEVNYHGAFYAG